MNTPSNNTATPATPATPAGIAGIATRALLVSLHRRMFNSTVTDKTATDMVAVATNVRKGRYKKNLFTQSAGFSAVREAYQNLYAYHTQHTLPWEDRGARLLPSDNYFEYTQVMRVLRGQCDTALTLWMSIYDTDVAKDQTVLGSLANPGDYPSKDDMISQWGHNVVVQPIPSVADFRVDVGNEAMEELSRHIEERVQAAQSSMIASLLEPLQAAAEKLTVPIGESGSVFRDTLVENIRDTARRMSGMLSLTDNPEVAEAVRRVAQLANNLPHPDALRTVATTREAVADEITAQVDALVNMFGGVA